MRICFLGSSSAEPTADNGYTSFLLEAGGLLALVDASGNAAQSVLRAGRDPRELGLVVLTHHHADHIGGYPSLVQTLSCMARSATLPVVCAGPTRARVRRLHEAFDLDPPAGSFPVRFLDGFEGSPLSIRLLPGRHSVPTWMARVEEPGGCLLYTSDTAPNPAVAGAARGCRVLIHEATFPDALAGEPRHAGHSSALQAGRSAAAAGVARLFLCHINWRLYAGPAAPAAEARAAFGGEVVVPQPFRWYCI